LAKTNKSPDMRGATNQSQQLIKGKESMLLQFRRSAPAVFKQRPASNHWQAVALEVTQGVGKAVLLIGSMTAGIMLSVVLAAISSQP
jgi:hypothetical protein